MEDESDVESPCQSVCNQYCIRQILPVVPETGKERGGWHPILLDGEEGGRSGESTFPSGVSWGEGVVENQLVRTHPPQTGLKHSNRAVCGGWVDKKRSYPDGVEASNK